MITLPKLFRKRTAKLKQEAQRAVTPVQTAKKVTLPKPVGECNFAFWGLSKEN